MPRAEASQRSPDVTHEVYLWVFDARTEDRCDWLVESRRFQSYAEADAWRTLTALWTLLPGSVLPDGYSYNLPEPTKVWLK